MLKIFDNGKSNLTDSCLVILTRSFLASLHSAYNDTAKYVFQKAELSPDQNAELLEQFNFLKRDKSVVDDSLVSIMESSLDDIVSQIENRQSVEFSSTENEELELSLEITQMESVLDIKYSKYLHALEYRFKVLFAYKKVNKSNMPLGVAFLSSVISQLLDVFDWNSDVKIHLVKKLLRYLKDNLLEAYEKINLAFAKAGILPNIQLGYKPEASKPYRQSEDKAKVTSDSAEKKNASTNLKKSVLHSTFGLMNQGRKSASKSVTTPVGNDVLIESLKELAAASTIAVGSTEMDKLKEMSIDHIRNKTGIYYPGLNDTQHNVFDLMGMIYDILKNDESVDQHILSSLSVINIPLLCIALTDESFFESPAQPARAYFDAVMAASRQWYGTSVVGDIHNLSAFVASDFGGSSTAFSSAVKELESYLRLARKRAEKAEHKWVNSSKGREKMEISRAAVASHLSKISGLDVPAFISSLIDNVLKSYLTVTALRHGESSKRWKTDIQTVVNICRMADLTEARSLNLRDRIESLQNLEVILERLGFPEKDKILTIENIRSCLKVATQGLSAKNIELKKVTSVSRAFQPEIVNSDNNDTISERELNAEEKSQLVKFKLTPIGTVFDFVSEGNSERIRRKLIWLSPLTNRALFVSLMGTQPLEKSLNSVAINLIKKNMVAVKTDKMDYFEYALQNVYKSLKEVL